MGRLTRKLKIMIYDWKLAHAPAVYSNSYISTGSRMRSCGTFSFSGTETANVISALNGLCIRERETFSLLYLLRYIDLDDSRASRLGSMLFHLFCSSGLKFLEVHGDGEVRQGEMDLRLFNNAGRDYRLMVEQIGGMIRGQLLVDAG